MTPRRAIPTATTLDVIDIDTRIHPGPWRLLTVSTHGPLIRLLAPSADVVMYLAHDLSAFYAHGIKTA